MKNKPRSSKPPSANAQGTGSFTRRYAAEDDAPAAIRQKGKTFYLQDYSGGKAKYSPTKPKRPGTPAKR